MKVQYRVQGGINFDAGFEERVVDAIAAKAEEHFRVNIAPHVVDVAQARCPVSQDRNFNPRKSSFSKVALATSLPGLPRGASPKDIAQRSKDIFRLSKLRSNQVEIDPASDAKFFRGTGSHAGQTPDAIAFRRGGVAGAFRHQPGTLKKSIKFDGVTREGNRVIATVRAHAHYAHLVHEGFNHVGGKKIAPKRFLVQGAKQVRERLLDSKAYG